MSDDTLTPFIVVLDGRTLVEVSRLYLPEYVHVPVGFHSSWVPDAEPDRRSFYQPRRNHVKPAGL
jgi:rhodanese-related sulfurtransferase